LVIRLCCKCSRMGSNMDCKYWSAHWIRNVDWHVYLIISTLIIFSNEHASVQSRKIYLGLSFLILSALCKVY
jgi:hypothetical protein